MLASTQGCIERCRRYIPKADGGQRPLGTMEDKVVQALVVAMLNLCGTTALLFSSPVL
jgi:hypothetical protein